MITTHLPLTTIVLALLLSGCASQSETTQATENTAIQQVMAGPGLVARIQQFDREIGDRVFFALDSAVITPDSQQRLQRQADWLKANPDMVARLEGHADERGTRDYNFALGERRAAATRDFLVALGVGVDRLQIVSFGKERPAAIGSGENVWAQNRRVVTVVGLNRAAAPQISP